jgi:hypothetical protein
MTTRERQMEHGIRIARSVLECGGLPPLSSSSLDRHIESARVPAPFKTWRSLPLLLVSILLLHSAFCLRAWGQYSIDWSTIDGGGGTSTGGVYTVSGTIGQPDAGTMSGGAYTLSGGFWGVLQAVQTPGAPWLAVTRTATNSVVVSWPLPGDGWVLEFTNRVSAVSAAWPRVSQTVQTNAAQAWVVEPAPTGNRYYRLHKP